jgi:hypothetical protein
MQLCELLLLCTISMLNWLNRANMDKLQCSFHSQGMKANRVLVSGDFLIIDA